MENTRRILSATFGLLSVPAVFICTGHQCMGGHMMHTPYSWFEYASDVAMLPLLIGALWFCRGSNMFMKTEFAVVAVFTLLALGAGMAPLPAIGLLGLSIQGLFVTMKPKVNSNMD